jgi:hypothetical protein
MNMKWTVREKSTLYGLDVDSFVKSDKYEVKM